MMNKDQNQDVGNNSTAIQAGGDVTVVNLGITASEARAIALDVAKSTFYELSGEAKETANIRVEEITNKIIEKLEKDYPAGLQKAKDPDFQYALFTVQKEYARNGDKDLGDLLVDLLIDRSKHDQRDILQIVLNESLSTAPKLTESNLAALAVIFLFRYTQDFSVINLLALGKLLDKHILPFVPKLSKNAAGFLHLVFTGCGSIEFAAHKLENLIGDVYQGLFLKGFDKPEISDQSLLSFYQDSQFFIPCLNDNSKLQINATNKESLEKYFNQRVIPEEARAKILKLFDLNKMNESEIKEKIFEICPYMKDVFEIWNNSEMQNFALTSVGMAIGHANIKRLIGEEFADLSIWIN